MCPEVIARKPRVFCAVFETFGCWTFGWKKPRVLSDINFKRKGGLSWVLQIAPGELLVGVFLFLRWSPNEIHSPPIFFQQQVLDTYIPHRAILCDLSGMVKRDPFKGWNRDLLLPDPGGQLRSGIESPEQWSKPLWHFHDTSLLMTGSLFHSLSKETLYN